MNAMRRHVLTVLAGTALLLGAGWSPLRAEQPAGTQVHVTYANPEHFSESRRYGSQDRFNDVHYLGPLKAYLIKRATPMLEPGQQLDITVTDVQLAGGYEPWRRAGMSRVRIMSNLYPPRIDLHFRWIGADGKVLREGSRKLRNLGYLDSGAATLGDNDPLRYDKALLANWLRRGLDKL